MSTSEDNTGPSPSAAAEALSSADAAARRIRSRRGWYIAGTLVMAVALAAFSIALASWPDRLADLIIPGLLVVGAILALLAWSGRTIPTAAVAVSNRVVFISAVAKPGLKSLLAGEVGTGPGTGQLVLTDQQLPVAPVITSNSFCLSSPSFSASTKASPMAICCTASTMLLHTLAACPAPVPPQ